MRITMLRVGEERRSSVVLFCFWCDIGWAVEGEESSVGE